MNTTIPPYYHPTTVCFIDDNFSFLRSLSADLPDDWSFTSYLDPEDALAAINRPDPLPSPADRCFSMDASNPVEPVIHLNLGALEQEINFVHRFERVSVVIVDYAMPAMNGLEFCEHVRNKHIKKALMTSVADEKTAVRAFNKGIIDRYIPKSSLACVKDVIPHVEELKREYFAQYSARFTSNLALNPPAFTTDGAIASIFHQLLRKYRIVEYYLAGDPYGYLMLRADGSMFRLVVLSQDEHHKQINLAVRHGAPSGAVRRMRAGRLMGYFDEHPEDYFGNEAYPWSEALIPATRIDGAQTWFIGVAENPPADIDFDPQASSYRRFLRLERPVV